MTPRQLARREAILHTVRKHLAAEGYDALNMRGIAAAAGVSPSTLYAIYGSKEALILYAVGDSISDLNTQEASYPPGLERFVQRLASVAGFFAGNPEAGEAITRLLFERPGQTPATDILMVNALKARRASLEEMLAQGEISAACDIDFHARTLVSITWGTVFCWLQGLLPLEAMRGELTRASLTTLLPVASATAEARMQALIRGSGR